MANLDWTVLSQGDRKNEGVRLENSIIWSIFLIVGRRKMPWQARLKPISDNKIKLSTPYFVSSAKTCGKFQPHPQ